MNDEGDSTTSFTPSLADVWFREEHGELRNLSLLETFISSLISILRGFLQVDLFRTRTIPTSSLLDFPRASAGIGPCCFIPTPFPLLLSLSLP